MLQCRAAVEACGGGGKRKVLGCGYGERRVGYIVSSLYPL